MSLGLTSSYGDPIYIGGVSFFALPISVDRIALYDSLGRCIIIEKGKEYGIDGGIIFLGKHNSLSYAHIQFDFPKSIVIRREKYALSGN